MKLAHPQLDAVFDFDNGKVNTVVIENAAFFRGFLRDIHFQISGNSGSAVLSIANTPVAFSGNAELIGDFLSFEISRKSLISKLLARLEALAVDETHYLQTVSLVGELEQYIQELSMDLPCDVYCGKMSLNSIIRAVGVAIPDDYENDLERLLDYMELSRELERDKLFIFVNLRDYYSDEEVQPFFNSILSHEYHVLLVDGSSHDLLANERRQTIDEDLCEF